MIDLEDVPVAVSNDKLRAARQATPSRVAPGEPMSRRELAEAVNAHLWESSKRTRRYGLDEHTIGRYERGEIRWPSSAYRSGLRAVLNCATDAELGFRPTRRGNTTVVTAPSTPTLGHRAPADTKGIHIPALRQLLDLYDLPGDGPIKSLPDLQVLTRSLIHFRLNADYERLALEALNALPQLTRALFAFDHGAAHEDLASLLVQAYRAVDAIADKFGLHDLSARTIGIMDWAARQAGKPVEIAIATYVRAETFFVNGQFAPGRQVLERAAEKVTPGASLEESAAYGALHMRAAIMAARGNLPDYANEHIREARNVAGYLREGVYGGTAFGLNSVRIHEVSLAVEIGDPVGALSAAAGWTPSDPLPAERRSHFYLDLARAQLAAGRHDRALDALHAAWRSAPQHIRVHPGIEKTLGELARKGGAVASSTREFRQLAGLGLATS